MFQLFMTEFGETKFHPKGFKVTNDMKPHTKKNKKNNLLFIGQVIKNCIFDTLDPVQKKSPQLISFIFMA